MTSIGHRSGLFDTMKNMKPAKSHEIANRAGLGAMWGEEKAREMLSEAGFSDIRIKQLPHDFQNSFYIMKKAAK